MHLDWLLELPGPVVPLHQAAAHKCDISFSGRFLLRGSQKGSFWPDSESLFRVAHLRTRHLRGLHFYRIMVLLLGEHTGELAGALEMPKNTI